MFEIKSEPFGPFSQIKLINTKTGESAGIIADYGATLNTLSLSKKGILTEVIDGSPDYGSLITEGTSRYKGMILFPFPNRLKGGLYTHEGKMYQFDINDSPRNNSLHGILTQTKFEITKKEATASKAELEISYMEKGDHPAYPFMVSIHILYTFTKDGLKIASTIKNMDNKTVPVGLGWHPYFKTGNTVNSLELKLPLHKSIFMDKDQIPTGKIFDDHSFTSLEPVEEVMLDNGYQLNEDNKEISNTLIRDPANDITIEIWQKRGTNGLNFLQVYTPPHRDSIAVEPQTCAPDAFNNNLGLAILKPGEKLLNEWGVKIS